jgi:copper chaperone CopZ
MKKIVLIVFTILVSITTYGQKKKKNAKATIKVDGVCMMCKKRIEKAALNTKGVKYAVWNVNTHDLNVIFDERKTDVSSIKECVANVGHDTNTVKATEEVYNNLHPCCMYRDKEVRDSH